jgi:hypothetical protein
MHCPDMSAATQHSLSIAVLESTGTFIDEKSTNCSDTVPLVDLTGDSCFVGLLTDSYSI